MAAMATIKRLGCKPIDVDESYLAYLVRNIESASRQKDNMRLAELYCLAYLLPVGLQLLILARLPKASDDVAKLTRRRR